MCDSNIYGRCPRIRHSGKSYSGEPLEYIQFITIYDNENDTDGDGIPNDQDRCEFINIWIDEETGRDHCKSLADIDKETNEKYQSQNSTDSDLLLNGDQLSVEYNISASEDVPRRTDRKTTKYNQPNTSDVNMNIIYKLTHEDTKRIALLPVISIMIIILSGILIRKIIHRKGKK